MTTVHRSLRSYGLTVLRSYGLTVLRSYLQSHSLTVCLTQSHSLSYGLTVFSTVVQRSRVCLFVPEGSGLEGVPVVQGLSEK
jgi:hypothetical protein